MALFVLDEDVHRSVAKVLERLGHRVKDVRDEGLRGRSDDEIFHFAQAHKAIILTADLDFSDTMRFPLGSHHGIVILRFPNELSTARINAELAKSLKNLTDRDFKGNLVIVSPGRIRIRRKS
jgi:predicted nuclease of predicted toxin-antitoxin system